MKQFLAAVALVLLLIPAAALAAPPALTFIDTFGSSGTGGGQFSNPAGAAINRSLGKLYVVDSANRRVQRLNLDGTFDLTWGSAGSGPGEFDNPLDVAVHQASGTVYVTDYNNNRVQRFNAVGSFVGAWGTAGTGDGEFNNPIGVAVNQETGDVYVTEWTGNRVQQFTSTGTFIRKWGMTGSGPGQFDVPVSVAIHPITGQVAVADSGNSRVQLFTATGDFELFFSLSADGGALQIDPLGRIFVAEPGLNRLGVYSTDGVFLNSAVFPVSGSVPWGIAISTDLIAYVPLLNRNSVARLSVENARPQLNVTGPLRRVIRTARATITGTTLDDSEVVGVSYKLPRTRLRTARGTETWSARFRVPVGTTRVRFSATDNFNASSPATTIRLIRR